MKIPVGIGPSIDISIAGEDTLEVLSTKACFQPASAFILKLLECFFIMQELGFRFLSLEWSFELASRGTKNLETI